MSSESVETEAAAHLTSAEETSTSLLSQVCVDYLKDIGSHKKALNWLLPPLEALAKCDKATLRIEAFMSLKSLAAECYCKTIEDRFVPLVRRLTSEEFVALRLSTCDHLCACYQGTSGACECNFQQSYKDLCESMVWAGNVQIERTVDSMVVDSMVELYTDLASDEEESVCVLAVEYGIIALLRTPSEHESSKALCKKMFLNATEEREKSWKVRAKIAQRFAKAPAWLFELKSGTPMMDAYKTFLEDSQDEVRSQAAWQLKDVCDKFPEDKRKDFVLKVISAVKNVEVAWKVLQKDLNLELIINALGWDQLAEKLSANACNLAAKNLPPTVDATKFAKRLKPLFIRWLSGDDDIKRKLAVSNFKTLTENCGVVGVIDWMQKSANYVRKLDLEAPVNAPVIKMAEALGDVFKKKPFPSFIASMAFSLIAEVIEEMAKQKNPQIKRRALSFVNALAEVTSRDNRVKYLFPAVEWMAKDKDLTVRCELCKTIHRLCCQKDYLNPKLRGSIKKCLDGLEEDRRPEVQKAAKEAVAALFGTFTYKPFALIGNDGKSSEDAKDVKLWLRLRYCLDVVKPLLHSLLRSLLKGVPGQLYDGTDGPKTWEELIQFFVNKSIGDEKEAEGRCQSHMRNLLKILGPSASTSFADETAENFFDNVPKEKSSLILYLFVNQLHDEIGTEVEETDGKNCFEFLKNFKIDWESDKDKKKWDSIMEHLILFRNAHSHDRVLQLVDQKGGASAGGKVDEVFNDFLSLAEKIAEDISDEELKEDLKSKRERAKHSLQISVKNAWVEATWSALKIVLKGPSPSNLASLLLKEAHLLLELWEMNNDKRAGEFKRKLDEWEKSKERTRGGKLAFHSKDIDSLWRILESAKVEMSKECAAYSDSDGQGGDSSIAFIQTDDCSVYSTDEDPPPPTEESLQPGWPATLQNEQQPLSEENSNLGEEVSLARPPAKVTAHSGYGTGGSERESLMGSESQPVLGQGSAACITVSAVPGNGQNDKKQWTYDVKRLFNSGTLQNLECAQQWLDEAKKSKRGNDTTTD